MSVPGVVEIVGIPRAYAWGSTSAIQHLLGLAEDGQPLAELWLGSHPNDPSPVPALGTTLDALISSEPKAILGNATVAEFGEQLPFLLKLLAADKPLSIQVHPTLEQAEAGFAAEDAAGVPRDAPNRNYRDPNHKPELLCALTRFEALCGFRPVAQIEDVLKRFALAELEGLASALRGDDSLRTAFTYLLTLEDASGVVAAVTDRAAALAQDDPEFGAARAVLLAAGDFPGDIGVVLSLLLNYLVLQPGEAIYLGAGNVHAYLRGFGVEIMANSDNVLRCGLTPKHVDVTELLAITDFTPLEDPRWAPVMGEDPHAQFFAVPVTDFFLQRVELGGYDSGTAPNTLESAEIVVCVEGTALVSCGAARVELTAGRAAFASAGAEVVLEGNGLVFVASDGL